MSDRQQLRKQLRAKRNALTDAQQIQASLNLTSQILATSLLENTESVALYLTNDGEINPIEIINSCWQSNVSTSLPVLHPFSSGHLLFLDYHSSSVMVTNKYGIPEPQLSVQQVVLKENLDIVFVPLTGFDKYGNRIGMGGGYYDRTLASVNRKQTKVVGLAHQCQQVESIPTDNWDIPLDMIITDQVVIEVT